jgi:hypothetical protein
VPVPVRLGLGALGAASVAGASGYAASWLAGFAGAPTWLASIAAIAGFGAVYFGVMIAAGVPEATGMTRRLRRR